MRIGLSSYTFAWAVGVPGYEPSAPLTALEIVQRAEAWGVHVVQFADNLPLHMLAKPDLDVVLRTAFDRGIHVEVGTRGIGIQLLEYLRIAGLARARFVRIVVDSANDHPSVSETITRLRAFEGPFREAGVRLAIENHDRFAVSDLVEVVGRLGDWTGICLDTVNSLGSLEPPEVVLDALAPYVINLHLKDFAIRRHRHQMGFEIEGTPAGAGRLDIPAVVADLDGRGVESGILELWTPPEMTVEQSIQKELGWAQQSVEYLATVPGLSL